MTVSKICSLMHSSIHRGSLEHYIVWNAFQTFVNESIHSSWNSGTVCCLKCLPDVCCGKNLPVKCHQSQVERNPWEKTWYPLLSVIVRVSFRARPPASALLYLHIDLWDRVGLLFWAYLFVCPAWRVWRFLILNALKKLPWNHEISLYEKNVRLLLLWINVIPNASRRLPISPYCFQR